MALMTTTVAAAMRAVVVALVLLVVCCGVGSCLSSEAGVDDALQPLPVASAEWPSGGSGHAFLANLVARRQPVIVKGSPAASWVATKLWSWDVLLDIVTGSETAAIRHTPLVCQEACWMPPSGAPVGAAAAGATELPPFMYFDTDNANLFEDRDVERSSAVDTSTVGVGAVDGGITTSTQEPHEGEGAVFRSLSSHDGSQDTCWPRVVEKTLHDFIVSVMDPEEGVGGGTPALYLTETLDHPVLADVVTPALRPLHWMAVLDGAPFDGAGTWTEHVVASMWAGGAHVTTQCHYDAQLNLFAQVLGRKRFVLWPPRTGATAARLYPFLHPRARKSQLHVAASRLHQSHGAVVAELGPGDVLFVPPFWLHHVTSLTPSLGINVFSPSAEGQALDAMLRVPLPLPSAWQGSALRTGACAFLRRVVEQATAVQEGAPTTATDMDVEAVLRSRYGAAWFTTAAGHHDDDGDDTVTVEQELTLPSMQARMLKAAQQVVQRLRSRTRGDGGVAAVVLGNYAEVIASNVVSNATSIHSVAAFLSHCRLHAQPPNKSPMDR